MASILNVDKIRATGSTTDALTIGSRIEVRDDGFTIQGGFLGWSSAVYSYENIARMNIQDRQLRPGSNRNTQNSFHLTITFKDGTSETTYQRGIAAAAGIMDAESRLKKIQRERNAE